MQLPEVKATKQQIMFTKNVDAVITEIMDLTIRDCVLNWYSKLVPDSQLLPPILK